MGENQHQDDLAALLARAKDEWQLAHYMFETASDPDLIDAAIHQIAAAEKRYSFLLKMAREQGSQIEPL